MINQSILGATWINLFRWGSQQRFQMSVNVQMISSEPLNLLLPKLAWWCIIMGQSVWPKDWFAIFKVKVTMKAHPTRYDFPTVSADPCAIKFNLRIHYQMQDCLVWRLDWCGHSEGSEFCCICQSCIFCTTDYFATKLGVLMYCY